MTQIRIGIEGNRAPIMRRAWNLRAPILVSANSLWNQSRQCFRNWHVYQSFDVALDSGGFVAMKRYGGYRWSVEQYVHLARLMRPTWWAQMDFCCEPEIAGDAATVARRIDLTAEHLNACQRAALLAKVRPPMPVLQGWRPRDYCEGPIYEQSYQWPDLVGVGSVCRRPIHGPNGILAVVRALDDALPEHTRLHLFGVKGAALEALRGHRRFASMDSMAWSMAAQMAAIKGGVPETGEFRGAFMERWYLKQREKISNLKSQI